MKSERHVLVVSTAVDVATDGVVSGLLQAGVQVTRLNTEDLPFQSSMTYAVGEGKTSLYLDGEPLPAPTAVWYRRVRVPKRPDGLDPGIYDFCLRETRAALLGGIASVAARWMSPPELVWRAELKPFQLQMAAELGLKVPRTVITNDPEVVREAFKDFRSMVAKPTRGGYVVVEGEPHSIYTSEVLAEHLDHLEDARLSPTIYQELVPKRFDVRVTIVGERIFAAAIDSQRDPAARVDWRRTDDPNLRHHRIDLPAALEDVLRPFMRRLGLTFGAIDLVLTPDGEFVFLEINPNGQWLWLDDKLELGISDEVVNWLSLS